MGAGTVAGGHSVKARASQVQLGSTSIAAATH
jgi:hypothetical protein